MSLKLASTAFHDGQTIPKEYTADGRNVSPPLTWTDPPANAKSLALICEDPDAPRGTFTHWALFNLPPDSGGLDEGAAVPNGAASGANDFRKVGYGGPAPPPGKPHHYVFKLLALDQKLNLPAGAAKDQFQKAVKGHVLAEGRLLGMYGRH